MQTCLSIAATKDLEVIQMDAVGAFLNGIPDETLDIKPPKGYVCKKQGKNIALLLKKSLYGLKQSPQCWYSQLKEFFYTIKFIPSNADPCVFISSNPDWTCGVHVHVEDLCIVGHDTARLKKLINERFTMEDLGDCSFFLGMRLVCNREARTIILHQDKYIKSILEEYGMLDFRPAKTPMIPNTHLIPATAIEISAFEETGENYRRAIGLLNYLVLCTRPDLALVASQLAQFLDTQGKGQWASFKRVLRYLKGTIKIGLTLGGSSVILTMYSDLDYAGCPFTRRSITGHCPMIGKGCVSWRAKKQPTMATSSTEAEYRAAYEATQEVIWLQQLLLDLGHPQISSTTLHCDNQGALALSKNPLYQSQSKHFDVSHH